MRIRAFVAMAAAVATVVPMAAQAEYPEECESPIRILSGRAGNSFDWGSVNCDFVQAPELGSTSIIVPGSSHLLVRYSGADPVPGNKFTGEGSTLTIGETVTYLRWEPATGLDGAPLPGVFDSQTITYSTTESVNGGAFTATVIDNVPDFFGNPTTTYERTYNTIG